MRQTDIMRKIGADLNDYCMELQQIYPEYTKSLIKEKDLKDKSTEEINEMILTEPILAQSMFYILENLTLRSGIVLRFNNETPEFIKRDIEKRFKSHLKK